jgi:hypothetical protein
MDGTALVDARSAARQLQALEMKCDGKEIPEALDGEKPTGWWIASECTFAGAAAPAGETGTLEPKKGIVLKGPAAMAVFDDRVIGILSPGSGAESALWWSWPLAGTGVEGHGTQGMFKKRPSKLRIDHNGRADGDGDGDSIVLGGVARLFRSSGRYQSGQESSLLKALGG